VRPEVAELKPEPPTKLICIAVLQHRPKRYQDLQE
jgi:hypothetical protein